MTGAHDLVSAIILVDAAEDGCIESTAWVQRGELVRTADAAVEAVESHYPLEDREEEESYCATGATSWLAPVEPDEPELYEFTPWEGCEPDAPGAFEFWIVSVVCTV